MNVKFCDRCKRKIKYNEVSDVFIRNYVTDCLLRKEICEECANDFINMIEYECGRYKLDTIVRVSKEAE